MHGWQTGFEPYSIAVLPGHVYGNEMALLVIEF